MNRLLAFARTGLAAPDGELLDRFLADRDEAAFAEIVRRYAPVVWGTCRRHLADPRDAEDAFQAAFLVLVRRARRAAAHPALGPWLYRVAVLTARNLARANRRRRPLAPLPHDIPAPAADPADARLDLDAALGGLSERQRAAVVLCHLQGLSRTEAAGRLGCAEGTLSATLAAALKKLRARLAGRDPLAVLAAGLTVPAGLSAATARTAAVYTTSAVRAAGVSPAVAGLTEGVLRMVWVKKLTLAAGLAVAAAGVAVGVGGSGLARQEGDKAPPADTAKAGEKGSGDDEVRRLTEELRKLEADEAANHKRQEELRQARVKAEVRRYEAQQAEVRKLLAGKAAYWQIELVGDGWSTPPPGVGGHAVRIEEFDAAGKPLGGYTVSPDARLLKRVLAGGLADPAGPRRAVLWPQVGQIPATTINAVLQACKEAGLKDVIYVPVGTAYPPLFDEPRLVARLTPAGGNPDSPAVLDLAKFGEGTMAVPSATPEPKKGEGGFVPFFSGRFDDPEKP